MNEATKKTIRCLGICFFVIYVLLMGYFLFFDEQYGRGQLAEHIYHYNLVPFLEIRRFWNYRRILGNNAFLTNIIGNMVGFIPFGFVLPIIWSRMKKGNLIIMSGLLLSLMIEVLQLFMRVGCFDVDDLILNTLGASIGYIGFLICNQIRRKYYGKKI